MTNIFENIKFGDKFITRDKRIAVYIGKNDSKNKTYCFAVHCENALYGHQICYYHEDGYLEYDYDYDTGELIGKKINGEDIISTWKDSKENLDWSQVNVINNTTKIIR